MIAHALLVFIAVAVGDVCWARWAAAAADGRRWSAASWGVGIYALGSFCVISYTNDHWMIVPALLGAFVGNALGVRKK